MPTVTPNNSLTSNKKKILSARWSATEWHGGCFGEGNVGFGNFSFIKVGLVIPYSIGLSVPTQFCQKQFTYFIVIQIPGLILKRLLLDHIRLTLNWRNCKFVFHSYFQHTLHENIGYGYVLCYLTSSSFEKSLKVERYQKPSVHYKKCKTISDCTNVHHIISL